MCYAVYIPLFNCCEIILLGTLIENKVDWVKNFLDINFSLALSILNGERT